jgi:hypothetical protein
MHNVEALGNVQEKIPNTLQDCEVNVSEKM